jgi:pantothenate kinase-related protein Tda10
MNLILIHFSDAENTQYVYAWRSQQEAALRASKGTGMTDEQVVNFVNGCRSCLFSTESMNRD